MYIRDCRDVSIGGFGQSISGLDKFVGFNNGVIIAIERRDDNTIRFVLKGEDGAEGHAYAHATTNGGKKIIKLLAESSYVIGKNLQDIIDTRIDDI